MEIVKRLLIFIGRLTIKTTVFVIPSILATFFILEIAIRILFKVSDSPDVYFDKELGVMYKPKQSGVYIKRSEINSKFRINTAGWNSPKDYSPLTNPASKKIAVIGDSFVEAFQVNFDESFPYLLEKKLNKFSDDNWEVYSIAHSGANLVQYLHYIKYTKNTIGPDIYVINIVDNDFTESLLNLGRKDNWSLKIQGNSIQEIPPQETKNMGLKKIFRKSAFMRFLTINLDLVNQSRIINKIYYSGERKLNQIQYTPDSSEIKEMISYVLDKYKEVAGENIILIISPNIFSQTITMLAEDKGILFINLDGKITNNDIFNGDLHWNSSGHEIVSNLLYDLLTGPKTIQK